MIEKLRESSPIPPAIMAKISVVTICMNDPSSLWLTCASVANQTQTPEKHIVVDSSSPDLRDQMRKLAENFNADYMWVDPRGTYGAMAEGLTHLPDDHWVIFLNATDWFVGTRTLELIGKTIKDTQRSRKGFSWGIGLTAIQDKGYGYFLKHPQDSGNLWKMLSRGTIGIAHPSMVCRAGDLRTLGTFQQKWHVSLDYELALSLGSEFGPPTALNFPTSYYDQNGGSAQKPWATLWSKFYVRRKVLGSSAVLWAPNSIMWTSVRFLLRKLRHSKFRATLLDRGGWHHFSMLPNQHFCDAEDDTGFPGCCETALIRTPS
ncbi:glycosyltransferase [Pontimonas sp.]|nr:glycosyltransferase [Pontimonas sp.]